MNIIEYAELLVDVYLLELLGEYQRSAIGCGCRSCVNRFRNLVEWITEPWDPQEVSEVRGLPRYWHGEQDPRDPGFWGV